MSMPWTAFLLSKRSLPRGFAICSVLFRVCMNLSTSPFALEWKAVTLWCWNPSCFANSLNSLELNGGPLSLSILLRVPYVAKMCFNLSFLAWKSVDGRLYHWISGSLVNQNEIAVSVWVRSTMVNGYCVPKAAWNAGHLDWFFSKSVKSCVYHAVHQWGPVFLSQN